MGRRWSWSSVAQPPEYPETEPTGFLGFLFRLGFGFVAASHVIVPARPASVVFGCAAPRSGHLSSMASGVVGVAARPDTDSVSSAPDHWERAMGHIRLLTLPQATLDPH